MNDREVLIALVSFLVGFCVVNVVVMLNGLF